MPVVYDEPRSIARKQIALLMRVLDGAADFEEQLERWRCVGGCTAMDPENFDDDPEADSRGRDLEETLDGLTARYERIHGMLEEEAQARTSFAAAVATAGSGACSAVIRGRPSTRLVAVLVGAADGARLSTDVAERFCDQTALGFNGAAACAVLEGLAGAARIVATAFEFEGADIDSITVDSIWACLRETATATGDAAAAVGDVGSDLAAASARSTHSTVASRRWARGSTSWIRSSIRCTRRSPRPRRP